MVSVAMDCNCQLGLAGLDALDLDCFARCGRCRDRRASGLRGQSSISAADCEGMSLAACDLADRDLGTLRDLIDRKGNLSGTCQGFAGALDDNRCSGACTDIVLVRDGIILIRAFRKRLSVPFDRNGGRIGLAAVVISCLAQCDLCFRYRGLTIIDDKICRCLVAISILDSALICTALCNLKVVRRTIGKSSSLRIEPFIVETIRINCTYIDCQRNNLTIGSVDHNAVLPFGCADRSNRQLVSSSNIVADLGLVAVCVCDIAYCINVFTTNDRHRIGISAVALITIFFRYCPLIADVVCAAASGLRSQCRLFSDRCRNMDLIQVVTNKGRCAVVGGKCQSIHVYIEVAKRLVVILVCDRAQIACRLSRCDGQRVCRAVCTLFKRPPSAVIKRSHCPLVSKICARGCIRVNCKGRRCIKLCIDRRAIIVSAVGHSAGAYRIRA